ncbi:MAG: hypothetical protein GY845_12180 [Planctomycetes bacterium]|nr:hypothetical protein [Planctomycetota bacterium]
MGKQETHILTAIEQGDAGATEKLLPLVYEELPRILRKVTSLSG